MYYPWERKKGSFKTFSVFCGSEEEPCMRMSWSLREKAKFYLNEGIITKDRTACKGPCTWDGWR